jgi:DNA polymerase/3'-5' exonuclease PolX
VSLARPIPPGAAAALPRTLDARAVADALVEWLAPVCRRVQVVGALRRGERRVRRVEIAYVGRVSDQPDPGGLFGVVAVDMAEEAIAAAEAAGALQRHAGGDWIKHLRHAASGLDVDLYRAREEAWANTLVLRTGPTELVREVALRAQRRGWKWKPYGRGFVALGGPRREAPMRSEAEVFAFVGLPYREPWVRAKGPRARKARR